MTATFTESVVEEAALAWLESVGWQVAHGPDIAADMPAAERADYSEVVLAQRLRDALARLNPDLPAEALEDAFRKLTRPEGADLIQRNWALHRLLVDGVTVEYRDAEGMIRGGGDRAAARTYHRMRRGSSRSCAAWRRSCGPTAASVSR